jgi:RimJ/RimL family protein N-acetyltransferase
MTDTRLTPGPRPAPVTLEGRVAIVAPLDPDRHAAALFRASHRGDPELLFRYLPIGPFADLDSYRADLARRQSRPDVVAFALLDRAGRVFGSASLMRAAPEDRTVEIGYVWFAPEAKRGTAATEAMYLLARHVFEDLSYRRCEWKCDRLNAPSLAAALRLGFSFEGVFRNHMIVKGRNRDTAWFAMIDTDWPAIREGFETWLAPENFDAAGRQVSRLAQCRPAQKSEQRPLRSQSP